MERIGFNPKKMKGQEHFMAEDRGKAPEIIEGEYRIIGERDADEVNKGQEQRPLRTDNSSPIITYTLLGINIATWILMSLLGLVLGWNRNTQLFIFGAKINELVARGQYWRLFTAMFLHIDILHLFFNSYALYLYGPAVERLFGKLKFTLIYIVSGLMGSLLSYMFSPNPAAGASGAIFGLMGSLLYFRKEKRNIFKRIFGPGLIIIIAINLLNGFMNSGIDNWGHIGGLLGGYLTARGLGLYKEKSRNREQKALIWLIIILIFIIGLGFGRLKYLGRL